LQSLDQFLRYAQHRQVPAVHLIGLNTQPLLHYTTHEVGRKESVVATQQEFYRYVWPDSQRQWLPRWSTGLASFSTRKSFGDNLWRDIVKEIYHHVKVAASATTALELRTPGILPA
jgi:hypothetical protein